MKAHWKKHQSLHLVYLRIFTHTTYTDVYIHIHTREKELRNIKTSQEIFFANI